MFHFQRPQPRCDAVIFDMDGLLIDSEPLWREAEIEIFSQLGVPLTPAMCHQTTGMRTLDVVKFWHAQYPWQGKSLTETSEQLENRVIEKIQTQGKALPGVETLLEHLKSLNIPMAIASGSATRIIHAVLNKLGIADYFALVTSAENDIQGKPHPATYLRAIRQLKIKPEHGIAFEDSKRGATAALAAGLFTFWVPDQTVNNRVFSRRVDRTLGSLNDLTLQDCPVTPFFAAL